MTVLNMNIKTIPSTAAVAEIECLAQVILHEEHTVVGRALMQTRQRPWAQNFVVLPFGPAFLFLVALSNGIVPCDDTILHTLFFSSWE